MTIELQFLGAARHVTGSKHLLSSIGDKRVLLDCGLVQGPRKMAEEQNRKMPVEPRPKSMRSCCRTRTSITAGALPRLVKTRLLRPHLVHRGDRRHVGA